jgi:hypothetical protein
MAESQQFQVFKTVTLGEYRNADAYLKALKAAGCRLGPSAHLKKPGGGRQLPCGLHMVRKALAHRRSVDW